MAPHAPLPGHINAFLTERARATVVAQFQGGEHAKRPRQDGREIILCSLAERQGLLPQGHRPLVVAPGRRRPSQERARPTVSPEMRCRVAASSTSVEACSSSLLKNAARPTV